MLKMLALVLLAVVAGCAAMQPQGSVDAIVAEAITTARAPAAEQAAVLARAEKAAADGAPADRLRLATLLATLPPPLRDDARAAELLQPIADIAAPAPGRFAALLAAQIAERRRLAREIERISRDAERISRDAERISRDAERYAREGDKREEALKQQIEALRAIERKSLEREESLRRRTR